MHHRFTLKLSKLLYKSCEISFFFNSILSEKLKKFVQFNKSLVNKREDSFFSYTRKIFESQIQ